MVSTHGILLQGILIYDHFIVVPHIYLTIIVTKIHKNSHGHFIVVPHTYLTIIGTKIYKNSQVFFLVSKHPDS